MSARRTPNLVEDPDRTEVRAPREEVGDLTTLKAVSELDPAGFDDERTVDVLPMGHRAPPPPSGANDFDEPTLPH